MTVRRKFDWGAMLEMLFWGVAFLNLLHLAMVLPGRVVANDFAHYYASSRLLLEGAQPYETSLEPIYQRYDFVYSKSIPVATNPPLLLWLFAPFAVLNPVQAFWAWVLVQCVSLALILWLTRRLLAGRLSARAWRMVCAGALASLPVYWHFFFSQCQLPLAAIVLAGFALQRVGRHTMACLAVTTAAVAKIFPVMLVPWFIWRAGGGWSGRLRCAGATLVWAVLLVMVTGVATWREFLQHGAPVLEAWAMWQRHFNFTVPSLVKNAAWAASSYDPQWTGLELWARVGRIVGVGIAGLAYGACALKSRRKSSPDAEAEFGLLTVAMLAGGPTAWGHYFVFLIFPMAVAAARLTARPTPGRLGLFVVVLVLVNLMDKWQSQFLDRNIWLNLLVDFAPLFGLLALGFFFAGALNGERIPPGIMD